MGEPFRLAFEVSGPPVPKERPRRDSRSGRFYTPPSTVAAEEHVRLVAALAMKKAGHGAPTVQRVVLTASFVVRDRRARDLDNLVKLVQDAMNGVVYRDDSQIDVLHASKDVGPRPGTSVVVEELVLNPDPLEIP